MIARRSWSGIPSRRCRIESDAPQLRLTGAVLGEIHVEWQSATAATRPKHLWPNSWPPPRPAKEEVAPPPARSRHSSPGTGTRRPTRDQLHHRAGRNRHALAVTVAEELG